MEKQYWKSNEGDYRQNENDDYMTMMMTIITMIINDDGDQGNEDTCNNANEANPPFAEET